MASTNKCACGKPKYTKSKTCRNCFYKQHEERLKKDPAHVCRCGKPKDIRAKQCGDCNLEARHKATFDRLAKAPDKAVAADREKARHGAELLSLRKRYEESLRTIEARDKALEAMGVLDTNLETFVIAPKLSSKTSEATAVIVASDWHIEERVGKEVSGLNVYSLDIAKARATKFFQSSLRLVKLLQQDVTINTVVLALLGDFISNDIHEEFPEVNELTPMHAIVAAQGVIISGIEFLLANSKVKLVIPCHSGNHARTTRTTRFSTENGHSLEYLMYLHLAAYFRTEPRVEFVIPDGYHSYITIYDKTIRFHHGHAIKYGGGIGGIFIPAYKAISQWNKGRHADLDVFGHFHQCKDGGNFLSNGSLIGYNGFALAIKADFEPPKQQLFLVDKSRGRTCSWPILVN